MIFVAKYYPIAEPPYHRYNSRVVDVQGTRAPIPLSFGLRRFFGGLFGRNCKRKLVSSHLLVGTWYTSLRGKDQSRRSSPEEVVVTHRIRTQATSYVWATNTCVKTKKIMLSFENNCIWHDYIGYAYGPTVNEWKKWIKSTYLPADSAR